MVTPWNRPDRTLNRQRSDRRINWQIWNVRFRRLKWVIGILLLILLRKRWCRLNSTLCILSVQVLVTLCELNSLLLNYFDGAELVTARCLKFWYFSNFRLTWVDTICDRVIGLVVFQLVVLVCWCEQLFYFHTLLWSYLPVRILLGVKSGSTFYPWYGSFINSEFLFERYKPSLLSLVRVRGGPILLNMLSD